MHNSERTCALNERVCEASMLVDSSLATGHGDKTRSTQHGRDIASGDVLFQEVYAKSMLLLSTSAMSFAPQSRRRSCLGGFLSYRYHLLGLCRYLTLNQATKVSNAAISRDVNLLGFKLARITRFHVQRSC
ncbi:hypothetical protein J6590_101493 [Homalodisca vitripennis]|nr:hypothetical protein J6590_101493 [Homalodisca vitripennis]